MPSVEQLLCVGSSWMRRVYSAERKDVLALRKGTLVATAAFWLMAGSAIAQECAREVEEIGDRLGIEVVSPEFFSELDLDFNARSASDSAIFGQIETAEAQTARSLVTRRGLSGAAPTTPLWVHDYDAPDLLLARSHLVGARTFSLLGREDFCRRGLDEAKEILGPLLDQ